MTYVLLAIFSIVAVSAASIVATQFLGRLPLAVLAQAQRHGRYAGLAATDLPDATPAAGAPMRISARPDRLAA